VQDRTGDDQGLGASSWSCAPAATTNQGGDHEEQHHSPVLVLFNAVSVFMSFLMGLIAMARFSWHARRRGSFAMNSLGALVVGFTPR
jgi:hypothetical protein